MKKSISIVIVLLLLVYLPTLSSAADWPMFKHDSAHSGIADEVVEPPLELLWKYRTDGRVYSSPAVSGGVVYVGSEDSYVYALDASTGSLKWKYKTGSYVYSSPAISGGIIYVGSFDNQVYALDASTGSLKWKYGTSDPIVSSPTVSDGVVYVGSWDSYVYALDASTGNLKWKYKTGSAVGSSPAVSAGVVYIGSWDSYVYALDANTGNLKWKYGTANPVVSSPAVSGDIVYVGSFNGYVYALGSSTGSLKWKYETSNWIESSPAVSGDIVYVGSNDSYVYAMDASTGSLKWKYKTGSDVRSSPAVSKGIVYVGSYDYYVYAIDASTGSLKWQYRTAGIVNSPIVSGGVVYVGSGDGYVYAFAPASTPTPTPTTGSISVSSTPSVRIMSAPSTIHGGEDVEVTVGWENIPSDWKLIVSLEKSDTDKDRLADDVDRMIYGSGEAVFKLNTYQIDKTYDYAKVWACLRDENDNWASVVTETSITALPAASPTPQIAATPAPTQKQDDGTTQMLILAGSAIIGLLVIALIAGKPRGKTPEPITKDVPSKPPVAGSLSDNVDVKTKLDYKGTTIIYKVKVENNTNEAISDVKFYPHVPDLFLLKENLKSIPLIEPKRSQTVTFEMRPTSECGICNVAGRVNYYDGASKNRKDIDFDAKSLSIICPVLHRKEITEDVWRELVSNLIKAEETGKDIPIDGETLFRMVSRTIKDDMPMHMLEQETTKGKVFNAVARFYAEGVGGLKYMAQVEVIGGVKKSMLLLKAWAEKEDALTGFFYGILDKIMMKIDVEGYTDEPIIKNYFFGNYAPGGRIIDQSDKTIQMSTEPRKCPNCGIEVEGEQKFCLECGAKL